MERTGESGGRAAEALAEPVFDGSAYRPFGELTANDAEGRAAELREVAGFGPTIRVRPVAQAWGELAKLMRERGAETVAALEPEEIVSFAERLWVISSGESMLRDPKEPPEPPPAAS